MEFSEQPFCTNLVKGPRHIGTIYSNPMAERECQKPRNHEEKDRVSGPMLRAVSKLILSIGILCGACLLGWILLTRRLRGMEGPRV